MEFITKRNLIILGSIIGGMLLATVLWALLFRPKPQTIDDFVKSFTKDFTSYEMANTADYNERLSAYPSDSYSKDFLETYSLQKQSFVANEEMGNFSKYEESSARIVSEAKNEYSATVRYKAKKKDFPGRSQEFVETNEFRIIVMKEGNKYFITNFTFITPTN